MDKKTVARVVIRSASCWTAGYLIGGLLGQMLKEIDSPVGKAVVGLVGWVGGTILGAKIGDTAATWCIQELNLEE